MEESISSGNAALALSLPMKQSGILVSSQTKRPKPRSKSSGSNVTCRLSSHAGTNGSSRSKTRLPAYCEITSPVAMAVDVIDREFRLYRRFNSRRQKLGNSMNVGCFPGVRTFTAMLLRGCRSQSAGRVQDSRHDLDYGSSDDDETAVECIELSQINDDALLQRYHSRKIDTNHMLVPVRITALLWCDKCGQPIVSVYKHCFVCRFCQFTCHDHCRQLITVQCPEAAAGLLRGRRPSRIQTETSLTEYAALWAESSAITDVACSGKVEKSTPTVSVIHAPSDDLLKSLIDEFNLNNQGLLMEMENENDSSYSGFVRIYMNLCRPITMCVSACPPSTILTQCEPDHVDLNYTAHVTSFYMPRGTSKVIHITSKTTTQDVIRTLLAKFNITDNPRKFVLYERAFEDERKVAHRMRRLQVDETPLALCLHWTQTGGHDKLDCYHFVLQENDPGEITWEMFSVPELENFLAILDIEERDSIERVRVKCFRSRILLLRRAAELCKEILQVNQV